MKVDEFISVIKRVKIFKARLEREKIFGTQQQVILKIYIQDLTNKINTQLLEVV